nr:mitochondrial import inner membrane translocase subunit TIM17-2-like [Tanacetum cinerariifolium]
MSKLLNDPCPDQIIQDTGFSFCLGAIGGSIFHFPKGLYNSPRGARFVGGAQAVRINMPRLGGTFAVWGALYSTFDCAFVYVRQKEDPWNSILAGAASGGLLSLRQGFGPMGRAVLGTAAFFALFEGVGIMFTKIEAQLKKPSVMIEEEPVAPQMGDQAQQGAVPSWFGGFFGAKKEETKYTLSTINCEERDNLTPRSFRSLKADRTRDLTFLTSFHGPTLLLGLKDFLMLLKLLLLVMVSTAAKVNAASEYSYYCLKSMFEKKLQRLVNTDINIKTKLILIEDINANSEVTTIDKKLMKSKDPDEESKDGMVTASKIIRKSTMGRKRKIGVTKEVCTFLCEDLIVEIFTRLPLKSVMNVRCLSKSWYSRIASPDFIRMYTLVRTMNTPEKVLIQHVTYNVNKEPCRKAREVYGDRIARELRIVDDCLALISRDTFTLSYTMVWVMREYGNVSSWSMVHEFDMVKQFKGVGIEKLLTNGGLLLDLRITNDDDDDDGAWVNYIVGLQTSPCLPVWSLDNGDSHTGSLFDTVVTRFVPGALLWERWLSLSLSLPRRPSIEGNNCLFTIISCYVVGP